MKGNTNNHNHSHNPNPNTIPDPSLCLSLFALEFVFLLLGFQSHRCFGKEERVRLSVIMIILDKSTIK